MGVKGIDRRTIGKGELRKLMTEENALILAAIEHATKNGLASEAKNLRQWHEAMKDVQIQAPGKTPTSLNDFGVTYEILRQRATSANSRGSDRRIHDAFENRKLIFNHGRRRGRRLEVLRLVERLLVAKAEDVRSVRAFYKKYSGVIVDGKTLSETYGITLRQLQEWTYPKSKNSWAAMRQAFLRHNVIYNKKKIDGEREKLIRHLYRVCASVPYERGDFREFVRQVKNISIEGVSLKKIGKDYGNLRLYLCGEGAKRWPRFRHFLLEKKILSPNFAHTGKKNASWNRKKFLLQEAFIIALTKSQYPLQSLDWKDWLSWSDGKTVLGITAKEIGIGKREAKKFLDPEWCSPNARRAFGEKARFNKSGFGEIENAMAEIGNLEQRLADCIIEISENKGWECKKNIENLAKTAKKQLKEIGLDEKKLKDFVFPIGAAYSEIIDSAMRSNGFDTGFARPKKITPGSHDAEIIALLLEQRGKWDKRAKRPGSLREFFVFNIPDILLKMRVMNYEDFEAMVIGSEKLSDAFMRVGFLDNKKKPRKIENPVMEKEEKKPAGGDGKRIGGQKKQHAQIAGTPKLKMEKGKIVNRKA